VRLAGIPRRGRGDTRARMFGPMGPNSCDPRPRRLQRLVSGSGAASATNSLPGMLEVCGPPSASEPRCTECLGLPPYLVVSIIANRLSIAVAVRSPPSEARASPRPRSRANQDVAFCVDQVLRSHNHLETAASEVTNWTAHSGGHQIGGRVAIDENADRSLCQPTSDRSTFCRL
jgi:hypothetical protein